VCANRDVFAEVVGRVIAQVSGPEINCAAWLGSVYCPTPTVIEAAQALYRGHSVAEISRSEAGAENLTKTAQAITTIISESQRAGTKSICFITGVPGAGKTLAGLNIANSWHDPENGEHAVFLSGNGPLVEVLREALARDDVAMAKAAGERQTRASAMAKVRAFIQNIHLNVKAKTEPGNWFLQGKSDIRSSFYLEDVATEFLIQGLELDWTCVAWDADLRFNKGNWQYYCFRGTRWQTISSDENKKYLKNAYRVLLTRARQGMVLFVPEGSNEDNSRPSAYYDHTYEYLCNIGIPKLCAQVSHRLEVLPRAGYT
jgi:schlafen family protein